MCGRIAILWFAGTLCAQPPSRPAFEVATIKLNPNCSARGGAPAPGRLELQCTTLRSMIRLSYSAIQGERLNARMAQVIGGPAWLDTDRYDVSAKAEGAAPFAQMIGPMLQALLEERFQVKVHTEPRETPVYALTVVKGSPKLSPAKEGNC